MFRELRRKDMAISQEDAMKVLENAEYGVVSTIGEDGYPYGVPMSYILMDNNIYYHCALTGHKIDNIEFNSKVSFTVVGRTELIPEKLDHHYESVIVFGRAEKVEGEEKIQALRGLVDKYAKGFEEKGELSIKEEEKITTVIKISIEDMQGKLRWGNQRF